MYLNVAYFLGNVPCSFRGFAYLFGAISHAVLSCLETVAVPATFDYYCFLDVLGSSSKKKYVLLLPPCFIFSFLAMCLPLA